jgi:membrane fusion protein (multidrug efflux system)
MYKIFKAVCIGFLGTLSLVLLISVAKVYSQGRMRNPPVPITVWKAKPDHSQKSFIAAGIILPGYEIPLRFETNGTIELLKFRTGDKVKTGEVIAQLSQRDAILEVEKARLVFDKTKRGFFDFWMVSPTRIKAKNQIDLAALKLEKTVLRSPQQGILGDWDVATGDHVTPAKRIGTLCDYEDVLVSFGVIGTEMDCVVTGQKVDLTVDSYPGTKFTGQVEKTPFKATPHCETLAIVIRVPNKEALLLPGMFVRCRITVYE